MKPRTSLRVTDGPPRKRADHDIQPELADKYGRPWTAEEIKLVVLNPEKRHEELARDLRRSPGSVNSIRSVIRAVAGATSNTGGWVNEHSSRARLAKSVLADLGFESWTEEQRDRYLVRGKGQRSDGSQKAQLFRRGRTGQRSDRSRPPRE